MFFGKSKKWNASVKKLQNNEISVREFVDANEKKTLYYSTPFFENANGHHLNALQKRDSDIMLFPIFSSASDLKAHMMAIGCRMPLVIKGDLKSALDSLDSHPLIQAWGIVIDPHLSNSVEIPPNIRVK